MQNTTIHYFLTFFLGLIFFSCKGQVSFIDKRVETTKKILYSLKEKQPNKVLDYTYAGANNIDDKEIRDHLVGRISSLISKYGIPDTSKWIIKHNPNNNFERLVIIVPLFKARSQMHKHICIIEFIDKMPDIFLSVPLFDETLQSGIQLGFCNEANFESIKTNLLEAQHTNGERTK